MDASFSKWWLLPAGVLGASVWVASIILLGPYFSGPSSSAPAECPDDLSNDYSCYQRRYQDLVTAFGVEAALAELEEEATSNKFVRDNCHQITHVIGRAAFDSYENLPATYGRGSDLCTAGYYHGVMESAVAKIGADRIIGGADTLCSEMRETHWHSFIHYDCAHGLGHGFMGVLENEVSRSLDACDALTDDWEREPCYAGVFMQNVMAEDEPSRPHRPRADQPFYPCTEMQVRYKTACYRLQTSYALQVHDNDFAGGFELCAEVEEDFRPVCYGGLGGYAFVQSSQQNPGDVDQGKSIGTLCKLGETYEARSNCVVGAAKQSVLHHRSDMPARELCESFEAADLRAVCHRTAREYHESFRA